MSYKDFVDGQRPRVLYGLDPHFRGIHLTFLRSFSSNNRSTLKILGFLSKFYPIIYPCKVTNLSCLLRFIKEK